MLVSYKSFIKKNQNRSFWESDPNPDNAGKGNRQLYNNTNNTQ